MLGNVAWFFLFLPIRSSETRKKRVENRFISILWFLPPPSEIVYALPRVSLWCRLGRAFDGHCDDIDIKIGSKVIRVIWYGSVVDGSKISLTHSLMLTKNEHKKKLNVRWFLFSVQWVYRYSRNLSGRNMMWFKARLNELFWHLSLSLACSIQFVKNVNKNNISQPPVKKALPFLRP